MSTSIFQAEDWVYVADSMGRLGQGYYKNRNNSSQTITANEFEKRRTQNKTVAPAEKEQTINKTSSSSTGTNGLLSSASSESEDLTPWDNPLIGEQTAKSAPITPSPKITTSSLQEKQVEPPSENEKIKTEEKIEPGDGGAEGAKVVCTELARQGLMQQRERRACMIYAYSRLPNSFMTGYHFWAVPYVRLMRKSALATALIIPFVTHRTREVCYRLGLKDSGSLLGKIICATHDPLCSLIGHLVPKTDTSTLYQQDITS